MKEEKPGLLQDSGEPQELGLKPPTLQTCCQGNLSRDFQRIQAP
jgi:hypothetical protein